MATITEPMALDKTFNTTETTPRSQADVLAAIESAIRHGFGRSAADVSYDNTTSGLTADDVQEAIDELAAEKVDKVEGKGLSSNDFTDEDKEALDNMELDIESTQTVSGNPITLTDCAPINAESLVVELEPKQDLHGYDYPWVGGAGKNICSPNFNDWTATQTYLYLKIPHFDNSIYTMSFVDKDTSIDISEISIGFMNDYPDNNAEYRWVIQNGVVQDNKTNVSIAHGINCDTIIIYRPTEAVFNKLFQRFYIQVEKGTATSFAPYSNICPITGYTECDVDDVGKNLVEDVIQNNNIGSNGFIESDTYFDLQIAKVKNGVKYTITTDEHQFVGGFFTTKPTYGSISYNNARVVTPEKTFTAPIDGYVVFRTSHGYNTAQLEQGSTATTFEPYHSSNATIQFGQTVYGVKSNFTDGGTSDEDDIIDLGALTWYKQTYGGYTAFVSDNISNKTANVMCSNYKAVQKARDALLDGEIGTWNTANSFALVIRDSTKDNMTDVEFKAAMSGVQLVYKKATPTQISTPPTDLKLLKGTNNITTNGTTINLGYQPDNVIGEVKGEIEQHLEMPYLRILDNDVDTEIKNYQLYYRLISSAYTLVNLAEMLQHRFLFVEVIQNPSGTANHKLLHSALIDPRTIDGFEYQMKAGTGDTVIIESNIAENKFDLSVQYTGTHTSGDPTDYYVTIRMVD